MKLGRLMIQEIKSGSATRALKNARLNTLFSAAKNYAWQMYQIRAQNEGSDLQPTYMHLEITTYCPRRCQGCYIPESEKLDRQIMNIDTARDAIRIGRREGNRVYNLIGGETLTEQTVPLISALAKENRSVCFHVCTNSFFLSEKTDAMTELIRLPNIIMGLSVDGFQPTNDSIRGAGAFKRVEIAADYLASNRCFFGALVTLREANKNEILTPEFLDFLVSKGFLYAYFLVSDESLNPQLTRLQEFGFKKPIFIATEPWGTLNATSKSNRPRTSYVDRDGRLLMWRSERKTIGTLKDGLRPYSKDSEWAKHFVD